MRVGAIIPAAGAGRRMGGQPKAFIQLAGKPMLQHSVDVFLAHPEMQIIVIALSGDDAGNPPEWLKHPRIVVVPGGAERADSVRAGLDAMPAEVDAVIVHDAARPLVTAELIDRVLAEVRRGNSTTVALPVTDTLHEVDAANAIRATADRERFWRAQTPQGFPRDVLELAFASPEAGSGFTDEAGLVAAGSWPVTVVPGEPWNIKVTTPEDLQLAESKLLQRKS